MFKRVAFALAALAMLGLSGCMHPGRVPAVTVADAAEPTVLGLPNARFYIDTDVALMQEEGAKSVQREFAALRLRPGAPLPPARFLALSGGGDDGAFGAGLLVGWTATGRRPSFKIVTGISTGALIAPFAFLGSDYDGVLRAVYTETSQKDIFTPRMVFAALTNDAMSDTTPLYRMISRYVDANLMARIAKEYRKGRLLLIATTNLDAGRPVIWNIGAIANSGHPQAIETIKRILLASASIPGAFPPVMFDVDVNGVPRQEMHVDGGAVAQVFLYPPTISVKGGPKRKREAYIIRNGRFSVPWTTVDRQTLSIAGRAVNTMITSNGIGDLYRIYATTQRDGVDFNLAVIGPDFTVPYKTPFEQSYMRALFNYGYEAAIAGYKWRKTPPGL
ncbi:hypothetical protein FHS85_001178 [Rhodoligotrophos appendicifer]|uniref:patatin-like phospholipase family protein n=1 Tax=Rhodoligotrophos appendicifer TaxID=987056 RepID=UPI0011856EBC|nr:patatin-like phospholipase family protein [Rhodoligotrophos appendicifer]